MQNQYNIEITKSKGNENFIVLVNQIAACLISSDKASITKHANFCADAIIEVINGFTNSKLTKKQYREMMQRVSYELAR